MNKIVCPICKVELEENQFLKHRSGIFDYKCKHCRLSEIDDMQIDTVVNACKLFDIPFIPDTYYRYIPYEKNSKSIFGKYLSLMKLPAYRNFKYKDTTYLIMMPLNVNLIRQEVDLYEE